MASQMISLFGSDDDVLAEDFEDICRGKLCCQPACPAAGVWHPAVVLHSRDNLRLGEPIVSDHHFCDGHWRTVVVHTLVDDEFWGLVVRRYGQSGPAFPDRAHCRLMFFHRDQLADSDMEELTD